MSVVSMNSSFRDFKDAAWKACTSSADGDDASHHLSDEDSVDALSAGIGVVIYLKVHHTSNGYYFAL
eukprot:6245254-Amphidinium_carterae.1